MDLERALSTAEGIYQQLRGSLKLPDSVREALGIEESASLEANVDEKLPSPSDGQGDAVSPAKSSVSLSARSDNNRTNSSSSSGVEVLSDPDIEARYARHFEMIS